MSRSGLAKMGVVLELEAVYGCGRDSLIGLHTLTLSCNQLQVSKTITGLPSPPSKVQECLLTCIFRACLPSVIKKNVNQKRPAVGKHHASRLCCTAIVEKSCRVDGRVVAL